MWPSIPRHEEATPDRSYLGAIVLLTEGAQAALAIRSVPIVKAFLLLPACHRCLLDAGNNELAIIVMTDALSASVHLLLAAVISL